MNQQITPRIGKRHYHDNYWTSAYIFVFGSNSAGIMGAGAAKYALDHCGAKMYKGEGLCGHSYALPTKDRKIRTLPLEEIEKSVKKFFECAASLPNRKFYVTRVGCGLAGYRDDQIAPMFKDAPSNCYFPLEWAEYLEK